MKTQTLRKKLVLLSICLLLPLAYSQSSFAGYWVHPSQCIGNTIFDEHGAYSSGVDTYSQFSCWIDVSNGYGDVMQIDIYYTQNPVGQDEGVTCSATSLNKDNEYVHKIKEKKVTGQNYTAKVLTLRDKTPENENNAAMLKVTCKLPPHYIDSKFGSKPVPPEVFIGGKVFRIRVY